MRADVLSVVERQHRIISDAALVEQVVDQLAATFDRCQHELFMQRIGFHFEPTRVGNVDRLLVERARRIERNIIDFRADVNFILRHRHLHNRFAVDGGRLSHRNAFKRRTVGQRADVVIRHGRVEIAHQRRRICSEQIFELNGRILHKNITPLRLYR